MKTPKIIMHVAAVCILTITFIGGSVLAQRSIPSSSKTDAGTPVNYSNYESQPGNNVLVGSNASHSTHDGSAPSTTISVIDESNIQIATTNEVIPSSGNVGVSPSIPEGSPVKVEPMPMIKLGNTNAPAWNASIRFAGSTLRPRTSGIGYDTNNGGGCIYATSGDPAVVWNLSLNLPNGVKVEYLRMYYYDADPAKATIGWLTKYDLLGDIVNEWGVSSEDDFVKPYRDVLITPTETIDYSVYSYVLNWQPVTTNSNLQLCGFRIFYTQTGLTFLPVLNRP